MKHEISKEVINGLSTITKEPSLCQVVMHNDDFTPMEFVVGLLERFFFMSRSAATEIMMEAHIKGSAVCGLYTRDAADTKISQIVDFARRHEHPLSCSMEFVQ